MLASCCLFFPLSGNGLAYPVFPQSTDAEAKAQAHADRGIQLMQAGRLGEAELELRQAVQSAPRNASFLALLGGVLGMQRKLEESSRYFAKALELEPNDIDTRRNLASNQLQLGRLREARANLITVLKRHPADLEAMYLVGMTSEKSRDYAGAIKWLEASSSISRQHPDSLQALARSYYHLGNKAKARAALNQLSQSSAGPGAAFLGSGIASQAGDFEMAERMLQSIAETYPDPAALKQALASVRYKMGRYGEARQILLELVHAGTSDGAVYNLLAWCYWREGNPGEASRNFERAIAVAPFAEANYLDYSKALKECGHLPEAFKTVKQGVEKLPESASLQELKGDIETKMGLHREAIQSYGKAVRLNPSSPAALIGLGLAQADDLQAEAAITTFEKAAKRFPQNGLVHQEFGRMLLIPWVTQGSPGSETRATVLLKRAIALDPSLAEAHYQLGNLLLQKESIDEALDLLKNAARLEPKSSKVHFALERVYRKLGQTDEVAREHELFEKLRAEEEKSGSSGVSPSGRGN